LADTGKIYFASDFHLGLATGSPPIEREKKVVEWLKSVVPDAKEIYLLGDIFDFWWEYKLVVPRGFTRFLGTVAEITDSGIPVHFFTGNHDMWVGDYLSSECGMTIHKSPITTQFNGKNFHLAHGEGLGTKSAGYKILLSIFRNKPLQVMYSALHPSIGVGIGYARSVLEKDKIDYFIFGHRHLAMIYKMDPECEIVFLGDWIKNGSYAEWDGNALTFKTIP